MAQPPQKSADGHESPGKARHLYLVEIGLGAGLLLLVIALFVSNNPPAAKAPDGKARGERSHESANVVHLTSANWKKEVVDSPVPVLVDFWSPRCGPCMQLGPVIDRVAARYEGKVKVAKVNVDDAPEIANRFGIDTIPRVYIFNGGERPAGTINGRSEASIAAEINGILQ